MNEWTSALWKSTLGAALVWGCVRLVAPEHDLVAAWVGMIGAVLLLHFGTFHLLSLLWRSAGVDAAPIMRKPTRAKSLAEFWGLRWNLGFHRLAHGFVFRPLRRLLGAAGATLATFAASGLVHDLVISVPAGAGYGPPTAYFLIQGLLLLLERSSIGRRMGLGRGAAGRIFTIATVLAPLPWLFHPPFVRGVVVPFFRVIGAI